MCILWFVCFAHQTNAWFSRQYTCCFYKGFYKHRVCVMHIRRLRAIHVGSICAPCFSRVFAVENFDLSDICGNRGRRYSTVEYYCVCDVFLAAITVMQFIVPLCFCYSNRYVFFTLTGFADLDLQVNAFLRGEFRCTFSFTSVVFCFVKRSTYDRCIMRNKCFVCANERKNI